MAQWLSNKIFAASILVCFFTNAFSQSPVEIAPDYKDYKSQDQFNKFHKRAKAVAIWQINRLKEGALVVRLKTNKKTIDALNASGKTEFAKQKTIETYIANRHLVRAYQKYFTFCKVYFIYSNNSDSLLKGVKQGIFLDTNLLVDNSIIMKENFYLLADRDYAYNSSIGFVREDSAAMVKETGTPVREMGVIVKNKYGHQLKRPFPFMVKDKTFADYGVEGKALSIMDGRAYLWAANTDEEGQKLLSETKSGEKPFQFTLKKHLMYLKISAYIEEFNESLFQFYESCPKSDSSTLSPLVKPYLY